MKFGSKTRKYKAPPQATIDLPRELFNLAKIDAPDFLISASNWLSNSFQATERSDAFLRLAAELNDQQFWMLFHACWTTFEKIDELRFEDELNKRRDSWEKSYLRADDQKFYDSLPREVKIYRGQDADDLVGLSWTTSRDVAVSFAVGHRGILNARPFLIEVIIVKNDIAGAYTDRNQSEIVIYDFANDVDVVSSEILQSYAAGKLTTN